MERVHNCQVCGERFVLVQEGREEFPDAWHLVVAHDHDQEAPVWRCSVFKRSPGQRYPEEAKAIQQVYASNRRKKVEAERTRKAEKSTNRSIG